MGASTTTTLDNYHKAIFGKFGVGSHKLKVDNIPAAVLGYVTAGAPAANGETDEWEGHQMIALATNDEVHFAWATPHDCDYRFPVYVRWGLYAVAASKVATCLTTFDQVSAGGTAADGATALTDTIPAKTPGDNKVDFTKWGEVAAATSDYDYLFLKMVATSCTTADNVKVWCLEIAYTPMAI